MTAPTSSVAALNVPDMLNLMALFTDEENNTFEQVALSYQRDFNKKDNLRVAIAMLTLLRQQDLLPRPTQRLLAMFLLHEMYREVISTFSQNPFAPLFYKLLLLKKTPKQIMMLDLPTAPPMELGNLEAALKENQNNLPPSAIETQTCILPSPDFHISKDVQYSEQQAITKTCEELLTGPKAPSTRLIIAADAFYRLAPPLHEAEDEMIWLHHVDFESIVPIWDPDMELPPPATTSTEADETDIKGPFLNYVELLVNTTTTPVPREEAGAEGCGTEDRAPTESVSEIGSSASGESWVTTPSTAATPELAARGADEDREIKVKPEQVVGSSDSEWGDCVAMLKRAIGNSLSIKETNWLAEEITKSDESIVQQVGMSPEKLPSLVENNPLIAVEVLLKLLGSKEISSYFETLIHMDLSVQGLEVVNRLTNVGLVRLVCVFLQALIRNKVINAQDLYIELQAFCVAFNSIREAAALYRVVQALSNGGAMDEETSGP